MKPDFWHVHPGHVHSGHRHCHWLRYFSTVWTYCVSHDELNLSSGDSWRRDLSVLCDLNLIFVVFLVSGSRQRRGNFLSLSLALSLVPCLFTCCFLEAEPVCETTVTEKKALLLLSNLFFFFFFFKFAQRIMEFWVGQFCVAFIVEDPVSGFHQFLYLLYCIYCILFW